MRTAIYGEQVRQSMIQLFEEDYNLVKKGITIGTDVTSASSSTVGYYDGNVYINSNTLDIWKTNGSVWAKQGNLKGVLQITTSESAEDEGVNVVTFTLTDGTRKSFNVKNGSKGVQGISITGAVDNGDGTFYLTLSDGKNTANIATIQGIRGEKGDKGDRGEDGATGRSVTSITSVDTGKNHVLSANFSDGTSNVITTVKDGNDGEGTGNMNTGTYDPTESGIVNSARALSDGTRTLTFNDVDSKANKNTTLAGYGIVNAYTKTEVDNKIDGLASNWDSVTDKPFDTIGNEFKTKTVGDKKQLALADTVANKINQLGNSSADKDMVLTANGDGTASWKQSKGGISPDDILSTVSAVETNTQNGKVVDALVIKDFSNTYKSRIIVPVSTGATGKGEWIEEGTEWTSTLETANQWIGYDDENVRELLTVADTDKDKIELQFMFEVVDENSSPVTIGGYQWDSSTGMLCIKFGNAVVNDTKIAIDVIRIR